MCEGGVFTGHYAYTVQVYQQVHVTTLYLNDLTTSLPPGFEALELVAACYTTSNTTIIETKNFIYNLYQ